MSGGTFGGDGSFVAGEGSGFGPSPCGCDGIGSPPGSIWSAPGIVGAVAVAWPPPADAATAAVQGLLVLSVLVVAWLAFGGRQ